MTGMVPGLHENTRPQRKGRDGAWAIVANDAYEARDAPPKWVAVGLAATLAALVLSVAGVLWFSSESRPRAALHASVARQRFHPAGPALEANPPSGRLALERAHPAPSRPALDAAAEAVVRQGWGNEAAPPSPADTALKRAEARR